MGVKLGRLATGSRKRGDWRDQLPGGAVPDLGHGGAVAFADSRATGCAGARHAGQPADGAGWVGSLPGDAVPDLDAEADGTCLGVLDVLGEDAAGGAAAGQAGQGELGHVGVLLVPAGS